MQQHAQEHGLTTNVEARTRIVLRTFSFSSVLLSLFFCNAGAGPRDCDCPNGSNCCPARVVGSLLYPTPCIDVIGRSPTSACCMTCIAVPIRMAVPGICIIPPGCAIPPGILIAVVGGCNGMPFMRMAVPGGIKPAEAAVVPRLIWTPANAADTQLRPYCNYCCTMPGQTRGHSFRGLHLRYHRIVVVVTGGRAGQQVSATRACWVISVRAHPA